MKARIEQRRAKLPPILEIDEDGLPVFEMEVSPRRWSSDDEAPGVQMADWPTEFDE